MLAMLPVEYLGTWVGLIGLVTTLTILAILRVHLGLSLLITAIVTGIISIGPRGVLSVLVETSSNIQTLNLIFITFMILVLIGLYKTTNQLSRFSESLRLLLRSSKLAITLLPTILGLLPVIGGALMSAPIVDIEGKRLGLSVGKRVFVNLWFRHIIMVIYPLNQALVLTATLSGLNLWEIIIRQIPIALFMFITGFLLTFKGISGCSVQYKYTSEREDRLRLKLLLEFVRLLSPIILAITVALVFKLNLAVAILLGIILLSYLAKPTLNSFTSILRDETLYLTLLAAYSAMLLKNIVITSGIPEVIAYFISQSGISHIIVLTILPLTLSLLLGLVSSGIALAIPLIQGITDISVREVSLIYISSYLGYLSSPSHLCLIVTTQYFKTHVTIGHRYLIPLSILTLIFTIILYYIWY